MKTAEEIITSEWKDYKVKGESFKNLAIKAMKLHTNQKLDKAAEMVPVDYKDSILSLKEDI